uniref:Agouti-related protein isoform X1 n=2 Tax=Geotrypetes seraphini TaxID=260995 RepID=A0A6P8QRY5_GEOSA|nr:agouti-related protein isoform X1 [Geotrypetes seraphini]
MRGNTAVMFNTLLLFWGMLQGIQIILSYDPNNNPMEEMSSSLNNAGRYSYPDLLHKVKGSALTLSGTLARSEFDRTASEVSDEDLSQDTSLLDPRVLPYPMELQIRDERSPRRCVQLLESCVGHLPCCNPCAICYCRFFNAFCYCRKINHKCHHGKN